MLQQFMCKKIEWRIVQKDENDELSTVWFVLMEISQKCTSLISQTCISILYYNQEKLHPRNCIFHVWLRFPTSKYDRNELVKKRCMTRMICSYPHREATKIFKSFILIIVTNNTTKSSTLVHYYILCAAEYNYNRTECWKKNRKRIGWWDGSK